MLTIDGIPYTEDVVSALVTLCPTAPTLHHLNVHGDPEDTNSTAITAPLIEYVLNRSGNAGQQL